MARTINQILTEKKVQTVKFDLLLDPRLAEDRALLKSALGRLEMQLGAAKRTGNLEGHKETETAITETEKQIKQLDTKIRKQTETFEFRALGRKVIQTILKTHRPTGNQIKEFQEGLKEQGLSQNEPLAWNNDTFPPALIAASCASHEMSYEDALQLWNNENFNLGELGTMWQTAWSINQIVA